MGNAMYLGGNGNSQGASSLERQSKPGMNITAKAAEVLREKLVQIYIKASGLDAISIIPEAGEILKEKLAKACFEAGIGFRMMAGVDEIGRNIFYINFDRERQGDQVLEEDGIRVFVDPNSASLAAGHALDYIDEPLEGFVLR